MAYYPSGNRPLPAYPAGYRYAPMAKPAPWPAAPLHIAPTFNTFYGQPAPRSTMPFTSPLLPRPSQFPQAPQPYYGAPQWYHGTAAPPPAMTISVNAPKMSREDIKKNFWLKFAATTASFVAGMGIVSYFGMSILPHRIALALGDQTHKSLLRNLSPESINELLEHFKNSTTDGLQKLHATWGNKTGEAIHQDKTLFKQFRADITPHTSGTQIAGFTCRQVINETLTEKFLNKIWFEHFKPEEKLASTFNDIKAALVSPSNQEKLVEKVADNATIKALLNNRKFSELSEVEKATVIKETCKIVPLSDATGLFIQESSAKALDTEFKEKQLGGLVDILKQQLVSPADQAKLVAKVAHHQSVKDLLNDREFSTLSEIERKGVLAEACKIVPLSDALSSLLKDSGNQVLNDEFYKTLTAKLVQGLDSSLAESETWIGGFFRKFLPVKSPSK